MYDAAAIAFLAAHRPTIEYMINAMCIPQRDRDDVQQEAAYRIIMEFRAKGPLGVKGNSQYAAWHARNACRSLFRKHLRERPVLATEVLAMVVDGERLPDEQAIRKDRAEILHRAIALLTPTRRSIVRQVLAGKSLKDAADALGVSPGNAKVLFHRAVNDLKSILKGK